MDNSWDCEHCGETHEKEEDCCFCHGEGSDEGQYCECPAGQRAQAEEMKQWEWMSPIAKRYNQAKRLDDEETAAAIKAEAGL